MGLPRIIRVGLDRLRDALGHGRAGAEAMAGILKLQNQLANTEAGLRTECEHRLATQRLEFEGPLAHLKAELGGYCFNYANLLAESGRLDEALTAYARADELGFDPWIFHHYRGNALDRSGKFHEALVCWEKAVAKEFPERIAAYSDIIMRLVFRGDRSTAEQWLQRASALWETSALAGTEKGDARRFLSVDYTSVVGHLSLLDYYVKAQKLGWFRPGQKEVLMAPPARVVNPAYLDYWRPFFEVKEDPAEVAELATLASERQDCIGFTVLNSRAHHYWEAWALVQEEWEKQGRGPLMKLDEQHRERGYAALRNAFGLEVDDWFVCLHVREPGFHGDQKGLYQTTRNADIETYRLAVQEVVRRGGKVIRVGDPSMRAFAAEGLFDYAHSDIKSDWMDVFLCAACRLFVGTASGLAHMPPVFGTPCALSNWSPAGMRSSYGADRLIHKMIWSRDEKRFLSFREMMDSPINHWQYKLFYDQRNLEIRDNSPEDIAELVKEMLGEDGLGLSEFQLCFEEFARREPICYGISPIGRHFAEKYQHLLKV